MAQKILHALLFSLALLLFSSATSSPHQSTTSLSLPLTHIDALSSSSYLSPTELFNRRLQRDSLRVKLLTNLASNATHESSNDITYLPGRGEYYIRLGVGTPAQDFYMSLDTGSNVMWLQSLPCKSCYNQSDPIFNPAKSKSYSTVPCGSPVCRKLYPSQSNCTTSSVNKTCLYQVSYLDGSRTNGDFATETLTFSGTRIDDIALGFGHSNSPSLGDSAGIIGLARGEPSFVSQTKNRYNGKFSYCFVELSSSKPSTLMFGDEAIPKTGVFTPLVTSAKRTFYYLDLQEISVGGTRIRGVTEPLFKIDPVTGDGGIIIDSGTTITWLKQSVYVPFRDAFRLATARLKRAEPDSFFDTCFDLSTTAKATLPKIVFHFAGGDVALPVQSYLFPISPGNFCFAFAPTSGHLSIIGNRQQHGFRVSYDLVRSRVGFLSGAC